MNAAASTPRSRPGRNAIVLGQTPRALRAVDGVPLDAADIADNPTVVHTITIQLAVTCTGAESRSDPSAWLRIALAALEAKAPTEPTPSCTNQPHKLGSTAGRRPHGGEQLTARERDVLALVTEGRSNKAIAALLYVSPRTVEKHVERLLMKTNSANRAQLVAYAHREHTSADPNRQPQP